MFILNQKENAEVLTNYKNCKFNLNFHLDHKKSNYSTNAEVIQTSVRRKML